MSTVVKQCTCKSDFQDGTYGKGMRVFNTAADGKKGRCTVCGKEINLK